MANLSGNTENLRSILDTVQNLPDPITPETPTIEVSSGGLITATANDLSATKQLDTQAAKTVTPTSSEQTVVSSGKFTTGAVKVGAIPSSYVKPTATKAATTYTPTTSNQTIASGTYCSGAQTIKGDANLVAANIVSGKSIFGVAGSAKVADHELFYTSLEVEQDFRTSEGEEYEIYYPLEFQQTTQTTIGTGLKFYGYISLKRIGSDNSACLVGYHGSREAVPDRFNDYLYEASRWTSNAPELYRTSGTSLFLHIPYYTYIYAIKLCIIHEN